jgi:hypothetical protein
MLSEIRGAMPVDPNAPVLCTPDGMSRDGGYFRPVWTPRAFRLRGDRFILACRADGCGHKADAPLDGIIAAGHGDRPWAWFVGKWTCAACGSKTIGFELDLARLR